MVVQAKAVVSVVADTKQFGPKVDSECKGIGNAVKGIGVIVGAVFAKQFVQAVGECINKAIEFERNVRAVEQSLAHVGGTGAVNLGKLREEFKRMATTYVAQGGPGAVAEDYRKMMTGAYDAASAQAELGNITKANMVWHGRYGDAVAYCNSMIMAFDLEMGKTTELLEKGAIACDRGEMSFDELSKAAGKYTPAIKSGVITTDEFIALVSTMTGAGASGRAALAGIGDALLDLPDSMDAAEMSYTGFTDALKQLRDKKMTEAEWKEFAPEIEERTSLQFIISLYGDIIECQEAMTEGAGLLARETDKEMKTVEYRAEQGKCAWNDLKITIGSSFLRELANLGSGLDGVGGNLAATTLQVDEATGFWATFWEVLKQSPVEYVTAALADLAASLSLVEEEAKLAEAEKKYGKTEMKAERLIAIKEIMVAEGIDYKMAEAYLAAMEVAPEERLVYKKAPKPPPKKPPAKAGAAEKELKPWEEILAAESRREMEAAGAEPDVMELMSKEVTARRMLYDAEIKPLIEEEADAYEDEMLAANKAIGDSLANSIVSAFRGADVKDIFIDRLCAGVEAALGDAIAKAFAKTALSQIPVIGPFLGAFLTGREGMVIRAQGGVAMLPARPGGWTFPWAGKWINAAEGGQRETLGVFPEGQRGRDLIMRELLPHFFPETQMVNRNTFSPNIDVNLRGTDPQSIGVAVRAEQGGANRSHVQRRAA